MIPHRSKRPAASGLALALVVLGGLAGLAGAFPRASLGRLVATRADQATALPPPATVQPAAAAASAPCQVVAGPFTKVVEGSTIGISAEVQNAGAAPVVLDAIEAGWQGPALLTAVAFEGGAVVPVKSGTSPALVPLAEAGPISVPPGAIVSLRLVFTWANPDAAWAPGPIAVHVREGCVVALRPAAPAESACPLAVGRPAPDSALPEKVSVGLANRGADPIALAMLDLVWPTEANGSLVALKLGDGPEVVLDPALVRSPGALDLAPWLGAAVVLPAGAELPLTLSFERPAAPAGYVVSISTRQGCVTSATDWLANPYSRLELDSFEPRGHTAHFKLSNRGVISQTLEALDLFWTPAINGRLAQVLVDGKPIWEAGSGVTPTSVTGFARDVVIGPESTVELQLRFDPNAGMPIAIDPPQGSLDQPGPVAGGELGGDLTILAGFKSGAEAGFSTLRGDADGCRVYASDQLIPRVGVLPTEVSASVINTGSTGLLRSLTLTWPERNGNLTGVSLGGTELLTQPQAPGPFPFELPLDTIAPVYLLRGTVQALRLTFAGLPAGGGYTAVLGVDTVSGAPCAEVVISSPPIAPDCDKLGFAEEMEIEGRNVVLTLRNDNPDPVKISDLRIDWPRLPGMTLFRLNTVLLEDEKWGERIIWYGPSQVTPPITIRPDPMDKPAVIEPGTKATLRLSFDPDPPDRPPDDAKFQDEFRLSVGFVEGCRAAYPLVGARIASRSLEFTGVIRDFPVKEGRETVFGCCWQIFPDRGTEMRLVEVDANTQFRPESVRRKRGDIVQVDALVSPDGELYARRIIFRVRRPEESIVGPIEKMEPETVVPPSVPDQIKVNGSVVAISDRTDIPGLAEFRLGVRVSVRGTRNDADQIDALRVEILDPQAGESVSIRGAVREVLDPSGPGIQAVWVIDHYLVHVPDGVLIQGLPPSGRPGLGWEAKIEGAQEGDVIRATGGQLLPPPVLNELDGTLLTLPPGGMRGDWLIRTAEGERTFTVETSAVVNTRAAPVAEGMLVHAVVRDNGVDAPVAVSVRMEWP